jgi:DNA-binding CsgD family transcriptional regulator
LAIEGASNKEIAGRLGVSEATVKAHLTGIFRQLQLSGRLQLALLSKAQNHRRLSFATPTLPEPSLK